MKLKILILAGVIAAFASCGPSYRVTDQSKITTDTVVVPVAIRSSFTTQYPKAINVTWSGYDATTVPIDWELTGWPAIDKSDYVVAFDQDNERYYAWYDTEGNWIGTAYTISDYKLLPSAVSSVINDKFSGYTISSVHREMRKDKMAYEIQLTKADGKVKVLVDENGNIIKQKMITK